MNFSTAYGARFGRSAAICGDLKFALNTRGLRASSSCAAGISNLPV